MAIVNNKSSDRVIKEKKLYTGLCKMKAKAINPSKAEMERMGMNPKNDPAYVGVNATGDKKIRIDIYLYNEEYDINTKVAFFLENKIRESKKGTPQWINAKAQAAFSAGEPEWEWFSKEGLRKAYVGDVDLHKFVQSWANVIPGDDCSLETIQEIVKGDIKELGELMGILENNEVMVLLGVKEDDGKCYQGVYPKFFGRASVDSITAWKNQLNDTYGEFSKHDWQNDLMLKPYIVRTAVIVPSPDEEATDEDSLLPTEMDDTF